MWVNISQELLERVKTSLSYSAVKTNQITHAATLRDFMEAISEYSEKRTPAEEKLFQFVKQYEITGVLEFDEDAVVSVADDGRAYVMGWSCANPGNTQEKKDEPAKCSGGNTAPISEVRNDRADI